MSHDLAAIPGACAHAGNTCLREHYMYGSHIISWLLIRILLIQSNRFLLPFHPHLYLASYIVTLDLRRIDIESFSSAEARPETYLGLLTI